MTRSRFALAIVLAALGIIPAALTVSVCVAPAAPVPAHLFPKNEEADYFPIRVGNTWVYQVENSGDFGTHSFESKDVIDEVENVDGARVVSIDTFETAPGVISTVNSYKLKITPDGIFKIDNGFARFDPPMCLLKRGSRSGDRWETNTARSALYPLSFFGEALVCSTGSETMSITIGKVEPIKVPAGTFQSLRVERTVRWPNSSTSEYEVVWYASGVGVVKIESCRRLYPGQPPCTYSLKSFTPGKE